jgi:hypothetical protein
MEEVRANEQRATVEDLMYASVLEKFVELGVDMLPKLDNVVESPATLKARLLACAAAALGGCLTVAGAAARACIESVRYLVAAQPLQLTSCGPASCRCGALSCWLRVALSFGAPCPSCEIQIRLL